VYFEILNQPAADLDVVGGLRKLDRNRLQRGLLLALDALAFDRLHHLLGFGQDFESFLELHITFIEHFLGFGVPEALVENLVTDSHLDEIQIVLNFFICVRNLPRLQMFLEVFHHRCRNLERRIDGRIRLKELVGKRVEDKILNQSCLEGIRHWPLNDDVWSNAAAAVNDAAVVGKLHFPFLLVNRIVSMVVVIELRNL